MRQTTVSFTENHTYTCEYCAIEFVPKRRRVQKYCSNSCRSKAYFQRVATSPVVNLNAPAETSSGNEKTKIEKMSLAGVGNAAAGTAAVNLLLNLLTKEENKPATKGDMMKIAESLKRYHRIENLGADPLGRLPYFDLDTKMLVYM